MEEILKETELTADCKEYCNYFSDHCIQYPLTAGENHGTGIFDHLLRGDCILFWHAEPKKHQCSGTGTKGEKS